MFQNLRDKIANVDKFTFRGIIYAGLASCGLLMEIFILKQSRGFLIFGYVLVIIIGLVCISVLKEDEE